MENGAARIALKKTGGDEWDVVVLLQVTSPGRTVDDCRKALDLLRDMHSVVSVTPTRQHPFHAAIEQGGRLWWTGPVNTEFVRRQELPPAYERNGAIYVTWAELPLHRHALIGDKIAPYIMPRDRSIMIDTADDLPDAELKLTKLLKSGTIKSSRARRRRAASPAKN